MYRVCANATAFFWYAKSSGSETITNHRTCGIVKKIQEENSRHGASAGEGLIR
jgi:hypothetical protein